MARPKEFDPSEVLQEAMEAFWKHGYAGTSVNDLLEETGLNRGSLYSSFGDKRHLFLAALDRYDEQGWAAVQAALDQPGSAYRVIANWLREFAEGCVGEAGRQGCFVAKVAMELAPNDKEISQWLSQRIRRNERHLAKLIERGQREGDIPASLDAIAVSRLIWASVMGLRMMGAASPARSAVQAVIDLVLRIIEVPEHQA